LNSRFARRAWKTRSGSTLRCKSRPRPVRYAFGTPRRHWWPPL
jgi:hypothetical protein